MIEFYDSSAFAKLFLQEQGTSVMVARYDRATRRAVSRLAFLEVRSAIRRLEQDGDILADDATPCAFASGGGVCPHQCRSNRCTCASRAEQLLDRRQLRTLDAIQLASATSLGDASGTLFVTSDRRLERAARAEGFMVIDPNLSPSQP